MSHYCLQCGSKLEPISLEGRDRERCPDCGWVYYPQLKVGAAVLIEQDGKLLLVQRAQTPWQGYWYLPAGYVESDENPTHAAERETFEETGLVVQCLSLFGVYYFDDDPRGNGILLVFTCKVTGGSIHCNLEEAQQAAFFSPEMVLPLTGAGHNGAIQDWVARFSGSESQSH